MHIRFDPNGKRCEECGVGYAFGMHTLSIGNSEVYLCDSCMRSALKILKDEFEPDYEYEDEDEE